MHLILKCGLRSSLIFLNLIPGIIYLSAFRLMTSQKEGVIDQILWSRFSFGHCCMKNNNNKNFVVWKNNNYFGILHEKTTLTTILEPCKVLCQVHIYFDCLHRLLYGTVTAFTHLYDLWFCARNCYFGLTEVFNVSTRFTCCRKWGGLRWSLMNLEII